MNFIEKLQQDRAIDVQFWRKHPELRKQLVDDAYPDKAHFIYELLQNAEDARASSAVFELHEDRFELRHNGKRIFTEGDIDAITDVSKSGKPDDGETIGTFGIGFKSVFKYTETPQIYSGNYSFKISDFVYPEPIQAVNELESDTLFIFPFNMAKKHPSVAFDEIATGLEGLAETTLLFLTNLEAIRWRVGQNEPGEVLRIQHANNHFEVLKKSGNKIFSSAHFLRFSVPVEGLEKHSVSIAFALDFLPSVTEFDSKKALSSQFKIIPANPGRVAVFFPAEDEKSGLRFHLHAPFVPVLSRASIKETDANKPLFEQLAKLAAVSLHIIRDLKLLSGQFLGVLPNSQDPIPARYQPIRTAIIDEMNNEPLTPTHVKSHAPAKHLLQAKTSLKELLSADDIELLVDYEDVPPQWAIGASQKNILVELAIKEWNVPQFVEMLSNKTSTASSTSGPPNNITSQQVKTWLASKTAEWHQQMYSLLHNEIPWKSEYYRALAIGRLKPLEIVRLNNGNYSVGSKCYFPDDAVEHDELLPRVARDIYSSGNNKVPQEEARKLLEAIGVTEVGEAEQVQSILRQRYTIQTDLPDDETYLNDLNRFIALVEKDPDNANMFAAFYIYKTESTGWATPCQVFLDSPIQETDLIAYYDVLGEDAKKEALSVWYQTMVVSLDKFIIFAKATGVEDELHLHETTCSYNSMKDYLYGASGERTTSKGVNRDYYFPFLHKVIEAKSIKVSRLIWRTMCRHSAGKLEAQYSKSKTGELRRAPSLVLNWLESREWIPQGNGEFVRPSKASRELLPEGFPFDKGDAWIKKIHFGEEEQQRSEEHQKKQATAKELGFVDESALADGQWFADLDPEERKRYKDAIDQRRQFELPENTPINPEYRAERVGKNAADAPERVTEKRFRSVSVGKEDVKQKAEQYLRQEYTNADDEMICQICKAPLPFKRDDGNYYVEKVEFLVDLKKRHHQNYLALCPNHGAMFEWANGSRDILSEMFQDLASNQLEVILAQKNMTIYFTSTHRADLHAVINSIGDCEEVEDDDDDIE